MYLHSGLVQIMSPLLGWIKLYKLNSNVLHFHLIVSPFVSWLNTSCEWDEITASSWSSSAVAAGVNHGLLVTLQKSRAELHWKGQRGFNLPLHFKPVFSLLFLQKKRIDSGHALLGNAPRPLPSQFYPSITLCSSNEPHSEGLSVL